MSSAKSNDSEENISPADQKNETASVKLPPSAYYIIFVEGCERFAYYGFKAILLLFFLNFLKFSKDYSTAALHLFLFGYNFSAVIGAIVSDGFVGLYTTIFSFIIIYFVGLVVLTVTAIPPIGHREIWGPAIALVLIALGSGGVKPCVNVFGADQLSTGNTEQLQHYFAFYYFAINSGALCSSVVMPLIRSQVTCFGYDCYSLAFAVSTFLIFLALVIFAIGTPLYRRLLPKQNVIFRFVEIIWRAVRNSVTCRTSDPQPYWLHRASDRYSIEDIEDVRHVIQTFVLITPLIAYHALANQQSSRWVYQASLMDGSLGPFGRIQPDQMNAVGDFLVLLCIPLFERVIYPLFARCNWLIKPLQRIFFGMILMIFTFLAAAIVQHAIESKKDAIPVRRWTQIYIHYPCPVTINTNETFQFESIHPFLCEQLYKETLTIKSTCDVNTVYYNLSIQEVCPSVLIITRDSSSRSMQIISLTNPTFETRGVNNYASLRIVSLDMFNTTVIMHPNLYSYFLEKPFVPTDYQSVLQENYHIKDLTHGQISKDGFDVVTTAVYTVLLTYTKDNQLSAILIEDVPPFTVHMLWLCIQYALLSIAQVLIIVTVYAFIYAQAPAGYKAVIMAGWLLTAALGDLIVFIVAEVHFIADQTNEYIFFACLMAFATFIFGIYAIHFKQRKIDPTASNNSEDQQLLASANAQ